jgi:pimeloyl-ACP methyl ester carboxylesterase
MLFNKTSGRGKTVVFIHGYGETSAMWDSTVDLLCSSYRCISLDLPGFGKSDLVGVSDISAMASMLNEVLENYSIDKCVLIGHSMGAYVALEFAHLFPEKIDGLGLIHSTANADTKQKQESRLKTHQSLNNMPLHSYAGVFAPMLFSEANRSNGEWIDNAIEMICKGSLAGLQNATLAMLHRADRNHIFMDYDIPYFFLIGRYDDLIPMDDMLAQAASCKRSMVRLLESGHLAMVESPLKYKQAVVDYLLWVYR